MKIKLWVVSWIDFEFDENESKINQVDIIEPKLFSSKKDAEDYVSFLFSCELENKFDGQLELKEECKGDFCKIEKLHDQLCKAKNCDFNHFEFDISEKEIEINLTLLI